MAHEKKANLGIVFQVVGALLFITGMFFMFHYAITEGWLKPAVRVGIGFLASVLLIVAGEMTQKRLWSKGYGASGVFVAYLSWFAAFSMYSLISSQVALIISIAITLLAGFLSYRHNSMLIAFFGLLGCFFVPVISDITVGFPYLYVFSLGFILLGLMQRWVFISLLPYLFMLFLYESLITVDSFEWRLLYLGVFYTIFILVPYLYAALVRSSKFFALESALLVIGSTLFLYLGVNSFMPSDYMGSTFPARWLMGCSVILNDLLFILSVLFIIKTLLLVLQKKLNKVLIATTFLIAVVPLFLVGLFYLSLYKVIQLFFVFGVVGVFFIVNDLANIGIVFGAPYILGLFYTAYVYKYSIYPMSSPLFNSLNIAVILLFGLLSGAALMVHYYLPREHHSIFDGIVLGGCFTGLMWLVSPIWSFPYSLIMLAIYGLLCFLSGMFYKKDYVRIFSYATLFLGLFQCALQKGFLLFNKKMFMSYECFNLLLLSYLVVVVVIQFVLADKKDNVPAVEHRFVLAVSDFLIAGLIFVGIGRNLFLVATSAAYYKAILTIYYGVMSVVYVFVGLIKNKKVVRYFGFYLFVLTLWKLAFIIISMHNTLYRIVVFLVVGVLFMIASLVYQRIVDRRS